MGGGLAGKRRSLSILAWSIRGLTAQRLSAAADAPTETPPRLQTPTPQGPAKRVERMMKRWRMFWPAVAAARPVPKRTAGDAATGCSGEAPDRDECTATRLPVGVSLYMISAREKGFAFISLSFGSQIVNRLEQRTQSPTPRTPYDHRRVKLRPLAHATVIKIRKYHAAGYRCPISHGRLACAARPFPMSSTARHTSACASTTCRSSRRRSSGPRSTPASSVTHSSLEGGVADDRAMSPATREALYRQPSDATASSTADWPKWAQGRASTLWRWGGVAGWETSLPVDSRMKSS